MSEPRAGELVVEINHPKNSDVNFRPAGRALRSRFETQRSGARYQAPLNAFIANPIPGMRIHVDFKKRCARITDPLGDPGNKRIMETVNRVNAQLNPPRPQCKAADDEEYRSLSDEQLYSWLYYIALLVEGHRANKVDPNDPDLKFEVMPFAEIIQGDFPEQFKKGSDPVSLTLRQTGKILSYNIKPVPGEKRQIAPVPVEQLEAMAQASA